MKIGVSVTDGFTYIDRLSWDVYNDSSDLLQLNMYKERFGCYPQEVQAQQGEPQVVAIPCHHLPLCNPRQVVQAT